MSSGSSSSSVMLGDPFACTFARWHSALPFGAAEMEGGMGEGAGCWAEQLAKAPSAIDVKDSFWTRPLWRWLVVVGGQLAFIRRCFTNLQSCSRYKEQERHRNFPPAARSSSSSVSLGSSSAPAAMVASWSTMANSTPPAVYTML